MQHYARIESHLAVSFTVHEVSRPGDVHPFSGQLEVREEGDKNNLSGEARIRAIPRGTISFALSNASVSVFLISIVAVVPEHLERTQYS